jgi:hypothetical protein
LVACISIVTEVVTPAVTVAVATPMVAGKDAVELVRLNAITNLAPGGTSLKVTVGLARVALPLRGALNPSPLTVTEISVVAEGMRRSEVTTMVPP